MPERVVNMTAKGNGWNIEDLYWGIEWEPQLTLLNYPHCSVGVWSHYNNQNVPDIRRHDNNVVIIFVPREWETCDISIDLSTYNLEVRTQPVKFEKIKEECRRMNNLLAKWVCRLASYVGPVGVFLPASKFIPELSIPSPSKHLNISLSEKHLKSKALGIPPINLYPRRTLTLRRIHCFVEYDYTDYARLITHSHAKAPMKKAVVLGYSYSGKRYAQVRRLF